MTIPAGTPNRNDYVGNDTLAIYPFTFPIQSQDQLQVSVLEVSSGTTTQLVYDTDYTVTGEGNPTGGNVELVNISQAWLDANTGFLNTGYNMVIRMYPGLSQGTSISNGGPFYEESVESSLDASTMHDLQQQNEIDRSIKIPATENPSNFPMTLLAAAQRALQLLSFDANGKLAYVPVSPAYVAAPYSNWVAFTPTGTWTGNTTYTGFWRRIGDTMEVVCSVKTTGAPTPDTGLLVQLPNNLTIDTTKLANNTPVNVFPLGVCSIYNAARIIGGVVTVGSSQKVQPQFLEIDAVANAISASQPVVFANAYNVNLKFAVPILEWA